MGLHTCSCPPRVTGQRRCARHWGRGIITLPEARASHGPSLNIDTPHPPACSSDASGEPARCRRGIEEGLDRPLLAPTTPHSCFHPLLPRKILLLGHARTRTSGTRRSSSGISLQRSRPLPPCGKSENLWFPSGTEARPPGAGAGPLEHSRPTHAGGEHISPESFPVGVGRRGGQGRWETGRDTCVTRLGGREIEGNRHTGRKMVRGCLSGSMG